MAKRSRTHDDILVKLRRLDGTPRTITDKFRELDTMNKREDRKNSGVRNPARMAAVVKDSLGSNKTTATIVEFHARPQNSIVVYFAGTSDGLKVKVGISNSVDGAIKRIADHDKLAATWGCSVDPLVLLWSEKTLEDEIKKYWRGKRSFNEYDEWFNADEEVRGYLRWLCAVLGVADDFDELRAAPHIHSQNIIPSKDRILSSTSLSLCMPGDDVWKDVVGDKITEDDYHTNYRVIECAREVMGHIDLDPASCRRANKTVKADKIFTAYTNGLLHEWRGRIWLNPPFGQWKVWVPHILAQMQSGGVEQICIYAPTASISQSSIVKMSQIDHSLCILAGRAIAKCGGPKGDGKTSTDGAAIYYYGNSHEKFDEVFGKIGTVYRRTGTPNSAEIEAINNIVWGE